MRTATPQGKHGIQRTNWIQQDDKDTADDLALLSYIQKQAQVKTGSVTAASVAFGLNIHIGKSEILRYKTTSTNQLKLTEKL